jgi:hypothetical protein
MEKLYIFFLLLFLMTAGFTTHNFHENIMLTGKVFFSVHGGGRKRRRQLRREQEKNNRDYYGFITG